MIATLLKQWYLKKIGVFYKSSTGIVVPALTLPLERATVVMPSTNSANSAAQREPTAETIIV